MGLLCALTACGVVKDNELNNSKSEEMSQNEKIIKENAEMVSDANVPSESKTKDVYELISLLDNCKDREVYEQLFDIEDYLGTENLLIDGKWNKTMIHTGMDVELSINNIGEQGFDFCFDAYHYSQNAEISGSVSWKTEECAIGKVNNEYIAFLFTGDSIRICCSSDSENIGLMAGMTVDGTFIREEPEYTNKDILEETYSEADITALKKIIPKDRYNEDFEWVTHEGVVEVSEENNTKIITAYVPSMAEYGYTVTIINGDQYKIEFFDEVN